MKIGRNDPCPCGSGEKYKKCCLGKLSDSQLKQLYFKQLELTKDLNDEAKCFKVLEIASNIISQKMESECLTGTYVNMAIAKRVLFVLHHNINELNEAKEYCKQALQLKCNNQLALRMLFGICLDLKEYEDAYKAFELYEDENMFSPMSIQIMEEYQNAIMIENQGSFSDDVKQGLGKITESVFNKFGTNPGTSGVAIMYYLGVGNDVLKAYELGKRCIEKWPNSDTYNNLGWVCLNPEINRKEDAVTYYKLAIDCEKNQEKKLLLQGNYFAALMESKHFAEAETLIIDLIEKNPCNQNFSNYAELLKRLGKYEEALSWGMKALYLVEDDTTLLVVADIYKRNKDFDKAIEMYQLCLGHLNAGENVYKFNDHNKNIMYSLATNNSMDLMFYEVYRGLISLYCSKKDFESAKIYLRIAQKKLPLKNDWEIWSQSLSEIVISNERQKEIEAQLLEIEKAVSLQRDYIREWARKLLVLQNNSEHLNLDENDDWESYENEMESILNEMGKIINRNSTIFQNTTYYVNSNYSHLNVKSKEFLITAETLFEIHKTSVIDFAPIVVEYSKVVEKQLRILLGTRIPSDQKTLGGVLFIIKTSKLAPYNGYLPDLYKVNKLRKSAAHTGTLGKNDVEKIRKIFFQDNLLNLLI